MNCLLVLSLLFVTLLSKVTALSTCAIFLSCDNDPLIVGNGYRIGYIDNNKNKILACKSYSPDDCIAWDNVGNCRSLGAYHDCYDINGKYQADFFSQIHGYKNPFKYMKTTNYVVNAKNSNCYVSAYGNTILAKGLSKRTAGATHKINNRCLVGAGWCPC